MKIVRRDSGGALLYLDPKEVHDLQQLLASAIQSEERPTLRKVEYNPTWIDQHTRTWDVQRLIQDIRSIPKACGKHKR